MKGECIARLTAIGISYPDAVALRRIAMTLHRWYELECGDNNGCIERDDATKKTYWLNSRTMLRTPIADRESGAKKRLAVIMGRYPALDPYIQTDPRGAALYILRHGDVRAGDDPSTCYSNGIAVYQ